MTIDTKMMNNQAELSDSNPYRRLRDQVVGIAIGTLPRMLVSDSGPFCYELRADNQPKDTHALKIWRYTMMVLLGLARAESAGYACNIDIQKIFERTVSESAQFGAGDFGLLLWLAVRLESKKAEAIAAQLSQRLRVTSLDDLTGMEMAWTLIGAATSSVIHPKGADLSPLIDYFLNHRVAPNGFVFHQGKGFRRRFPNFATLSYSLLALSVCAKVRSDSRLASHAERLGGILRELQRDNGGWPWLYDANRGIVVEPFEVYGVHQHGMGPMALFELAEATGFDVKDMIVKSLSWLDCRNELSFQMIDCRTGLILRSIRRKNPRWHLTWRMLETCVGARPGTLFGESPSGLEVNQTCRPYELGWLLEAWCGRDLGRLDLA